MRESGFSESGFFPPPGQGGAPDDRSARTCFTRDAVRAMRPAIASNELNTHHMFLPEIIQVPCPDGARSPAYAMANLSRAFGR